MHAIRLYWMRVYCFRWLPDPDDAHVLAAAIAGHADCIVTVNLRHFPDAIVGPYGIEVVDPDKFIINQVGSGPIGRRRGLQADAGKVEEASGHARGLRSGTGTGRLAGHHDQAAPIARFAAATSAVATFG
jgi:hypothetical protein